MTAKIAQIPIYWLNPFDLEPRLVDSFKFAAMVYNEFILKQILDIARNLKRKSALDFSVNVLDMMVANTYGFLGKRHIECQSPRILKSQKKETINWFRYRQS